jgi:hypothetical protein
MFNGEMVNIARFATFHSELENVFQLEDVHGRDADWFLTFKFKDVLVILFAQLIEVLVK